MAWQLTGRSDTHPVLSFNDIDDVVRIIGDGAFFSNQSYATNDGLGEGTLYSSKAHLKWVVHDYHIKINRTFRKKKSNKSTYTLVCTNEACKWRLYAVRRAEDGAFIIKTRGGPHTCILSKDRHNHPHLTASFMATIVRENIKKNPRYTVIDIQVTIQERYGFTAKYLQCWRAKEIAISQLFGGWNEAYRLLPPLLNAIEYFNPGTKVQWFNAPSRDPNILNFQMVIWAFGPAIQSFQYCRPIIGIDATFLTGRYKGILMTCCGFDAEGQLVPLAFALADKEKHRTWENFMRFIRAHVVGSRQVCVISDRHASILRVFKEPDLGWNVEMGEAAHRYCSRHVIQNFRSHFKDKKLIPLVKNIFRQIQKHKFYKAMDLLGNKDAETMWWLYSIGTEDPIDDAREFLWSPAHDDGSRWGMMTTNGPESLNYVFKEARALPVTALVEVTFYKTVKYFAERRNHADEAFSNQAMFSPKVEALLEKRRLKGNKHTVHPFRMQEKYEVITYRRLEGTTRKGGHKHEVTFSDGKSFCTCQKPQLIGISCSHVLAVCGDQGIYSNQYVSNFYSAAIYRQTFQHDFNMYGSPDTWPAYSGPNLVPDPNLYKIKKGRRQTVRIKNDMDAISQPRNKYTCHRFGGKGHSRRTCTVTIANDEGN